jgi:hypothetical protein
MYTRVVELTSKSGKARELANTINDKVLPILTPTGGTGSFARSRVCDRCS